MKTLLVVTSICVALFIGCDKKNDGKGKETAEHQNDATLQAMNKVNADLERIRTNGFDSSDQQSLNKMSAALHESREKITDLEHRINTARHGDMAARKSGPAATSVAEQVAPLELLSEDQFKMKLDDLVKGLGTNDPHEQLYAARNVRELQRLYPDRDYSVFVIPLMTIVKNEDANATLRIVAARALYGTNSQRGDFALKGVSNESHDQSVRRACTLLSADRATQDDLARLEQQKAKEVALGKH